MREIEFRHEEIVLRDPHDVEAWVNYLDDAHPRSTTARAIASNDASTSASAIASLPKRYVIYERAIRHNPSSYKLWYFYLRERVRDASSLSVCDPMHASNESAFERALVTMHKMPKVWELYLEYLTSLRFVTKTRRACDRALRALPVTQHDRVWAKYLAFIRSDARIPDATARRVYRRYLKFEPAHAEEYVEFLRSKSRHAEVAITLAELVNDDSFQSLRGKSKHAMWLDLCDVITKHVDDEKDDDRVDPRASLDVDAVIRGGVRTFTDDVGRLWSALADYYIRRGLFEKARDVYEEAMEKVSTVRDFSLIFDAYAQFEESVLSAKMENDGEADDESDEKSDDEADDTHHSFAIRDLTRASTSSDVDLRLARLEHLMRRRPLLLSSVVLRQNPHNVLEWEKRVQLFDDDPHQQIVTYTEAIKTVDPSRAVGRASNLWVDFAKFYETHGDFDSALVVFEKALEHFATTTHEKERVYTEYAEFRLRRNEFDAAVEVMRRACLADASDASKSLKCWALYVDLIESSGDLTQTKLAYDEMIRRRVATPQIILNYAHLLKSQNFFEDAFQIYEKGVQSFKFPHSREIWRSYLSEFVQRYKGSKIERARDLFEQCLEQKPSEPLEFYKSYAAFEETYGLSRRAMSVYERACACEDIIKSDEDALHLVTLYVNRAMQFFGPSKVRDVFESALNTTTSASETVIRVLTMRFAEFERKLGELDRARALYVHASQFSDPRRHASFWQEFEKFEIQHGNEETFREMLRVKRAVLASYSDVHYNVAEVAPSEDAIVATTTTTTTTSQTFVKSRVENVATMNPPTNTHDDAEIDLDAHLDDSTRKRASNATRDDDERAKRAKSDARRE